MTYWEQGSHFLAHICYEIDRELKSKGKSFLNSETMCAGIWIAPTIPGEAPDQNSKGNLLDLKRK